MSTSAVFLLSIVIAPILLMVVQSWLIHRITTMVLEYQRQLTESYCQEVRTLCSHYHQLSKTMATPAPSSIAPAKSTATNRADFCSSSGSSPENAAGASPSTTN